MDAPSRKPRFDPYKVADLLPLTPYKADDILRGYDHVDYKQLMHEMTQKNPERKHMSSDEIQNLAAMRAVQAVYCMHAMMTDINALEERNASLEEKMEELTAVKDSFEEKFAQAEEARIKLIQELAAVKESFQAELQAVKAKSEEASIALGG